jgi:hypothetical protein
MLWGGDPLMSNTHMRPQGPGVTVRDVIERCGCFPELEAFQSALQQLDPEPTRYPPFDSDPSAALVDLHRELFSGDERRNRQKDQMV